MYNSFGSAPGGANNNRCRMSTRGRRKKEKEYELDPHRLAQRQKQIMYGENTKGFSNFLKALNRDPSLLKGCLPIKPSIVQKCSKRSWDGQVRKWRRALHMYDYVDFGESEEQSREVRDALIEQNVNPLFSPQPKVSYSRHRGAKEVEFTIEELFFLSESPLVQDCVVLPESLAWLDKRVDLDDDADDDCSTVSFSPNTPHNIVSPSRSPARSPLRGVLTERKARINRTPLAPKMRSVSSEPKIWLHNEMFRTPSKASPKAATPKVSYCESNKENEPHYPSYITPPHHHQQRHHPYMYCPLSYSSPLPYAYSIY
jgi:hypothetical protein